MALTTEEIAAIHEAIEQDAEAVRRGDWPSVASMFTVDAIRYPPYQRPVRGRDGIRAWLEGTPPIRQFRLTADEVVGCEDVAFVRGTYALSVASEEESLRTDRGHYMGLMRRQPDGSWLWATDMISSELPPQGW